MATVFVMGLHMRIGIFSAIATAMLAAAPAWGQAIGERTPTPQPFEQWTPTTSQMADTPARQTAQRPVADPSQPYLARPTGINAGAVTLYPSITAGALYDDNVFATSANRRTDWIGLVRPELGWRAAGQNYQIVGQGFVEAREYSRFNTEDQVNGGAAVAATVMPAPDTQLIGRLRYLHSHEERGGGESLLTAFDRPAGFDVLEAAGAVNQRFNRIWTSLGAAGTWINYQTPTVGGVPVSQSYRDGNISTVSGRVGYVVAPLTSLFVEVAGNWRNFQVNTFDSNGYRIVGGVLLEPGQGARVKGEAYIGYMHQDYTGVTFQDISTFTYGGTLAWAIAPRWTAVFEGRRQAVESALNGGVSVVESLVGARLDYAVLPNLVVGGGVTYLEDEFKTAGRTDHAWSPLVSVKYFVNPFVTLGFDYRHVAFDSSGLGVFSYGRNVYLLSLNARI